uniref:Uncharacterized protein n=1 Tax=Desulfovibrio sp. U5L TaxID=596152 RepID=I2Q570_9BACT
MNLSRRIKKLEQGRPGTGDEYLPRMARVLCRGFAREVAAGTRKPEDATEVTAFSVIRVASGAGDNLAERMEAAILRGKDRRDAQGACHG